MKPQLTDPFGRKIEYLRLSVTEKCNLRCFYCLPKGHKYSNNNAKRLTQNEMFRVVSAFTTLGVRRVRLTGGEPLVYKNLHQLAANISALPGLEDLSLSTNASLLSQQVIALKQAGITRINVSLDTLRPERFRDISGGRLADTLNGLMAAKQQGFELIKINMVAMQGINDDEFEDMVEFCLKHGFTLRFIETMPIGSAGRLAGKHYIDLHKVKANLQNKFEFLPSVMPGGGPARYVRIKGTDLRIGFITPLSQHFCANCNRVRLSSDGFLYLCLGQNHKMDLRPALREDPTNASLQHTIIKALALKPEKHRFDQANKEVSHVMVTLGG